MVGAGGGAGAGHGAPNSTRDCNSAIEWHSLLLQGFAPQLGELHRSCGSVVRLQGTLLACSARERQLPPTHRWHRILPSSLHSMMLLPQGELPRTACHAAARQEQQTPQQSSAHQQHRGKSCCCPAAATVTVSSYAAGAIIPAAADSATAGSTICSGRTTCSRAIARQDALLRASQAARAVVRQGGQASRRSAGQGRRRG